MNALLRLVRSFGPHARWFWQSEGDALGPERPATLRHLGAATLLDRLPWQVHASARIILLGPATASLILLAVFHFKYWPGVPFNSADFLDTFLLFAIPVGYAFGAVPALLTASLYCTLLTVESRLLQRRLFTRASVGAICGGLVSSVWFRELTHTDWCIYGLTGALVMAALSLSSPSTGAAARHLSRRPRDPVTPAGGNRNPGVTCGE